MQLLYLSYSKIPSRFANSIQVMQMCHAFAQQGWTVKLFCLRTSEKRDINSYYGLPHSSIKLVPIRMPRVKVVSRLLYGIIVLWKIKRSRWKGVIYGRDFFSLALLAKTDLITEPMYLEAHQPPSDRLESYLQKTIFRSLHFKGLIVISQALQQEYQRRYPQLLAGKIHLAHDAASPLRNASPRLLPASDAVRVGYTGSLQSGKGIELIAKIAVALPELEFHVVGGSEEQINHWSQQCAANVHFHGHQPPQKVGSYLAQFDIVIAPYQASVKVGKKKIDVARWMSPLKLFEYMAAGKPIVASDLTVLREVLHHQQNALLVAPSSLPQWKEAILQLANDGALREQLSQQAQQDFYEHYTWEQRATQISHLLRLEDHQTAFAS